MPSSRRILLQQCLGVAVTAGFSPATAQSATRSPPYELIDATPVFVQLLRSEAEGAAAVAAYKRSVIAAHATAFALIDPVSDTDIADYIARSRGEVAALATLAAAFPESFHELWQRFSAVLPLGGERTAVYLLPAPQQALGGSVRADGRRDLVILGAEVMRFAQQAGVAGAAFVHHELAHLHHQEQNREIRDAARAYFAGDRREPAKLHQILWLEGFAVFAAKLANPTASLFDLLRSRDIADRIHSRWREIAAMLRADFDATDADVIRRCVFTGDDSLHLPAKTGYYVGYLLASRLAANHRPAALARLRGQALRPALLSALAHVDGRAPDA
jgi:hypothetical protein